MRAIRFTGTVAFFAFCGVSFSQIPETGATEFRIVPVLLLSEEFNDNLFETPTSERSEFVTRVQPTIALTAQGGGLAWDMSYGLDYRKYARHSVGDELNHTAALKGKLSFMDGFLKIDLGDTYSRVSLNVARNVVAESLVVNQSNQNAGFISPYLTWHLADKCSLKTGYRYTDTRYFGTPGTDSTGINSAGIDKSEHDAFAELSYELSSRSTITAGYTFGHVISHPTSLDRHDVFGGFKHDFGQGTSLFATLGNSWQSFSTGVRASNPFWDVGASRDFGVLALTLGTRAQYTEDPQKLSTREISYNATLSRVLSRGLVTLTGSYTEYQNTQVERLQRQEKVAVAATGRHELRQNLALVISATGDHLSQSQSQILNQNQGTDYPYHLYGNVGLDYAMSTRTTLGANYSHVSYRNSLGSSAGSTEVNRAIVEMRISL